MPALPPIQHDVALGPLNTLRLAARAERFVAIESVDALVALRHDEAWRQGPALVLGGGSNIVLTGDVAGLVLHMAIRGYAVHETATEVSIECGAGENWDALVRKTLEAGFGGLENLIAIPGSAGAAPVQNIGAYGLELEDRIASVTALDCEAGEIVRLTRQACAFAYRDSLFRRTPGRYVIVGMTLRLPRPWEPVLSYGALARLDPRTVTPAEVGDCVASIRNAKLPDPAVTPNAGSFFKNPLVSELQLDAIRARHPHVVSYPQAGGMAKLAAAWLIDDAGWRGRGVGAAAMHDKQALVMVNRGAATAGDVLALASAVEASVFQRYGVRLEREPVLI